ncbi:MAG: hypothetical protein KF752_03170 [Pirellulaceae bacterium]|nr:hypothetical protein [Pirellulaceae bacterium]
MMLRYSDDVERRSAHRSEIKKRIRESEIAALRYQDLQSIIRQLDADSDRAASEHEAAASAIQAELSQLHLDLLSGKPAADVSKRRAELLAELTELNRKLETRCQSNKLSKESLERQASTLYGASLERTNLENRLVGICSDETRRKRQRNKFLQQALAGAIGVCAESIKPLVHNAQVFELNEANGFGRDDAADDTREKLDDWQHALGEIQSRQADLQRESDRLRQAALDE